ncbi:MAG: DNA topoisomerase I, partial [Bdellovibrionaceae bacterium]|nr:DNA topoisomerase I [Pseudobdellovibrionaceae bacterium]
GHEHSVTIPEDVNPSEITAEKIQEWIQAKQQGAHALGKDPNTGEPVFLLSGRYGYFVQLGEYDESSSGSSDRKRKRVSLPSFLKPEDVNLAVAIELLNLPKNLGNHPQTGKPVLVQLGRFGPYVSCDGESRSIPRDWNFLKISLDQALQLLAQEKGRGRGKGKKEVLREIGPHPEDQKVVRIYSGPYGPYINWGRVNVSIPKDLSLDSLSMDQAVQMLREKQEGQKKIKGA